MPPQLLRALLASGLLLLVAVAIAQESQTGGDAPPQHQPSYRNMTPEQRAAATRVFLGLGAEPDKAAAARGAPVFQRNCAFCHGPQARGASGPSLITSDQVLGDDHGERVVPYVKKGRPEKGMPSFADMPDSELKDIAEFLHLQVEEVANRGSYHLLNILVGNPAKGQRYLEDHCMSCHTTQTFAHIGSKFRSPEQLQRGWIWPERGAENALAVTASVTTQQGSTIDGRVVQISDFEITLLDQAGKTHLVERQPGVEVQLKDPLRAHQEMILTLKNNDMHDVTAYLASLK